MREGEREREREGEGERGSGREGEREGEKALERKRERSASGLYGARAGGRETRPVGTGRRVRTSVLFRLLFRGWPRLGVHVDSDDLRTNRDRCECRAIHHEVIVDPLPPSLLLPLPMSLLYTPSVDNSSAND